MAGGHWTKGSYTNASGRKRETFGPRNLLMYTSDASAPQGFRDLTDRLTTGVFASKADVPSQGTQIVVKRPSQSGYGVDYWQVGKPVRLGNGWTVQAERYAGYDFQRGNTMRLDRIAAELQRSAGRRDTRIFGKKG